MSEQDDFGKDPASIIEEIEQQLEEILKKRRNEIEQDLEERISREKEEARRRMDQVQEEMSEDKQSLVTYRDILSELETDKADIKKSIQIHLDRAGALQSEIEEKASLTVEVLNTVRELNGKLETLTREAEKKVDNLRKGLEDKYGISPEMPSALEAAEVGARIEQELVKLNKIKQLLESEVPEALAPEPSLEPIEEEHRETSGEIEEPETAGPDAEMPEESSEGKSELDAEDVSVETVDSTVGEEPATEEAPLDKEPESIPEPKIAPEIINIETGRSEDDAVSEATAGLPQPGETEAGEEEPSPVEKSGDEDRQAAAEDDPVVNELKETLLKYRKYEGSEIDGEVAYFENEDHATLDVEYIIGAIRDRVEEAKKLYSKLTQTESPKEQFFIKQEIIQHQESLRKIMLGSIRMCEKDSGFLPDYTVSVLNVDLLRTILEKVSMENWSNQEDFSSFDEYSKQLEEAFDSKITPRQEFLQSLAERLKIVG